MILGFTGTQDGMSRMQILTFTKLVEMLQPEEFHHGVCLGADAQAHNIVRRVSPNTIIVGHPGHDAVGENPKQATVVCDVIHSSAPYLTRNQRIVNSTDLLAATPAGAEVVRSGTWSTVRYARSVQAPNVVIMPDGEWSAEFTGTYGEKLSEL